MSAMNNNLIGEENDHFKQENAILLMETNQKHFDVEKVSSHMTIEKYQK